MRRWAMVGFMTDLGLIQDREAPALVELAAVDQARDVLREDGHRDRKRQLRADEKARLVQL